MMKMQRYGAVLFAVLALSCATEAQQRPAGDKPVNPDAALLQDFQKRIDAYMELHKDEKKEAPPLKETKEPAKIHASQEALGAHIRAARADAKHGDIFTPEIRRLFRRLMYPPTHGSEGKETKQSMKEDAPPTAAVPFKVNAKYPEGKPLPTMPPNVLAALPKLPETLEYRVIGKHLILLDVRANLIVDYIPNAIR